MSKGIKLSPKHGVNPTIPICFWCGEQKNEIALMGRMGGRKDLEAPKNMILDYEPCDDCKAKWETGVVLIEVSKYPIKDGFPPIQEGAYPTSRWLVVRPEALNIPAKAGDKALCLESDFAQILADIEAMKGVEAND